MTLTDSEIAYLRAELGEADRADLDARYRRLGSLHSVAAEVLRERKAALMAEPLAITVQGVAIMKNTENVRALERQIMSLVSADSPTSNILQLVRIQRRRTR